ncbi:MAG: hypothetical protein JST26_00320 [Bacteroidetes bacterium]|nr:hypothetical protein [Bacteroidota bacterium]
MKNIYTLATRFIVPLFISTSLCAQVITREDSLNAGLTPQTNPTVISGYGQAKVEYDLRNQTGTASLTRNVIFLGHRFNNRISFFSELELEDAKVQGGKPSGEISMEQLFLKFNVNRNNYIVAGLFIPRIGIINENHLPTTFNSNDRPFVEQLIIPATWRELGVSVYGQIPVVPGLNYSAAVMNGLNSGAFEFGSGIREGRFEGNNATASNLAVTGALLYYIKHFRIQASTYLGGTAGLSKRVADSLHLNYGAFGTPVSLSEFNIQYHGNNGIQFKALGTYVSIPEADRINLAYANNTPKSMYGYYVELGYNIFKLMPRMGSRSLVLFGRYESMDLNASVPVNGVEDGLQRKQYLVAGLHFQPLKGVSVKADFVQRVTGEYNKALYVTNPYSSSLPFYTTSNFINIGVGYSF